MTRTLDDLPAPDGVPFLGHAPLLLADPAWEVLGRAAHLGPMVRLELPPRTVLLLSDPALIQQVLDPHGGAASKVIGRAPFEVPGADDPFVAVGGEAWQRRRARHALSRTDATRWLDDQRSVLQRTAAEAARGWALRSEAFDLWPAVHRLGCDALSRMWIGTAMNNAAFEAYLDLLDAVQIKLGLEMGLGLSAPDLIDTHHLFEAWHDAIITAMPRRFERGTYAHWLDTLGVPDPAEASARQLMAATFAGGLSTPAALASALHRASRHGTVAEALVDTLGAVNVDEGLLDPNGLAACLPLHGFIRETLRCDPPVPVLSRSTGPDGSTLLGDVVLPPDTLIMMSPYVAHYDRRAWPDAHRFAPDRWTAARLAERPYGSPHFAPFGWGPRSCLGQQVALRMLEVMLATLLLEVRVEPEAPGSLHRKWHFACAVPDAFEARVSAR